MESIVSHLVMGVLGAGIVWWIDRPVCRQFKLSEGFRRCRLERIDSDRPGCAAKRIWRSRCRFHQIRGR